MFVVADLLTPTLNCETFDGEDIALDQAVILSDDLPEYAFGVWANENDELIAIAHAGELFVRAGEDDAG